MSAIEQPVLARRVLSPRECWTIANCSKTTYWRHLRPRLRWVQLSPKRGGHWDDEFYALLEALTKEAA